MSHATLTDEQIELLAKVSKSKEEAVNLLGQLDHQIVGGEYARTIFKPFGLVPKMSRIQDNRSEFKGAYFPDLKEGEWAEDVIDAADLAMQLCDALGLEYREMFGRGSQLRSCVSALREHLNLK